MAKAIKVVIKILNTIIVALFAIFALTILIAKFAGIQAYTILSGSMEPEYPVGALILVKEVSADELEVNDVITCYRNR